jgi:hypothetical protein
MQLAPARARGRKDHIVSIRNVLPFIDKLRKAGGKVETFFVDSSDSEHHYTTPHAALVMRDCIRGASHDEITAHLADFVAKDLAHALAAAKAKDAQAKAEAEVNAASKPTQPAPRAGKLLDGINLPGADYFNFMTKSADPAFCEKACGFDTTSVRRGGELLDFLRVNLCVAANEALKGLAPIGGGGYRLTPRGMARPDGGADGNR